MNINKAVLLAKVQAALGTDPTPTAILNAILCENPEYDVIDSKVERTNIKPSYGANRFAAIGEGQRIKFVTELKGSGAAATPPEIGVLFRGCGFTQTIDATPGSESVSYDPHSDKDGEAITIYYYLDAILHKIIDCRGTFSIDAPVNKYAKVTWEFTGIHAGPVAGELPTPTFNETVPPFVRAAEFAIDDYAAVIDGIKIDIKNDIVKEPDLNAATGIKQWFIKERMVSGNIDPEVVALATKDFWAMWEACEAVPFAATIGQLTGNRCKITGPAVQIDKPKYGNRENILTMGLPLVFTPGTVDDDISFKFD